MPDISCAIQSKIVRFGSSGSPDSANYCFESSDSFGPRGEEEAELYGPVSQPVDHGLS